MGWVDEQLRQRERADKEQFQQAFEGMASVVIGRLAAESDEGALQNALDTVFAHFRLTPAEVPAEITDLNDRLDYLFRPTGIMRRVVTLEDGWYKDAVGIMLTRTTDGRLIALEPGLLSGYTYLDPDSGTRVKVNKRSAETFVKEAIAFYRPLPPKKLGIKDLIRFIVQALNISDYIMIALATLALTLVGLILPYVNNVLFSTVLASGRPSLLLSAAFLLIGATIARTLLTMLKPALC